jgi:hypothetical protein
MRDYKQYTIMSAKGTTGVGNNINVKDFRHAIVSVNSANSANGTLKFVGSIFDDCPNFANAQSASNAYDFIEVKDLQDGSSIDGDAGLVLSGTDDNRLFELNINGLDWINARITAISAGDFTVVVKLYND